MEIKTYGMEDIGRRIEHLSDLHDLWSGALAYLTAGTYHSEREKEQIAELQTALNLLENHMMNDFNITEYAREINKGFPKEGS